LELLTGTCEATLNIMLWYFRRREYNCNYEALVSCVGTHRRLNCCHINCTLLLLINTLDLWGIWFFLIYAFCKSGFSKTTESSSQSIQTDASY